LHLQTGKVAAMAEDHASLFEQIRSFDWDPNKRESNLRNKKVDFLDARRVFDGPISVRRTDRHGEVRYQVFGYLDEREISVICTIRGEVCWLISARRASRSERRTYYPDLAR
jgi:uncharacterized DUF497 family protein